ncbi:MAG: DUF4419 domain-containing protein [Bacteroidetes bacterium]|nr:DUF4419 domain-containing protein [Bacteroidota bacterium]MBU1718662.1 DUF4419 domain-containing protein [Bacteroidota bacterium]
MKKSDIHCWRRCKGLLRFVFVLFTIICGNSSAQNPSAGNTGNFLKINVSDVPLAKSPLPEISFQNAIGKLTNGKIEAFSIADKDKKLVASRMHPFIAALHYGFAHHRLVSISPDMAWLMILQGFARHIYYYSDSLKTALVDFPGKKKLQVRHDEFVKGNLYNAWDKVFPEFTGQIKEDMGAAMVDSMLLHFSTTTAKDEIACQITLMDALSDYYSFDVLTACGIPYVILEGTPEDWKKILDHLPVFRKYGLEFWIDNLEPVIEKIYQSSKGEIDPVFWKSIYKWGSTSGGSRATGWATKFFPYIENKEKKIIRNRYLTFDPTKDLREPELFYNGLGGDDFTSGLSVCDFTWKYYDEEIEMQFCGGFVGISQDKNMVLRPEINWFVAEKTADRQLSNIEKDENLDFWLMIEQYGKEIDAINPKNPELEAVYYEPCANPDSLPVYNPVNRKTYKDGMVDFMDYLKSSTTGIAKGGKMVITFFITTKGYPVSPVVTAATEDLRDTGRHLIWDCESWSPAVKNGKPVLYKMTVEIDLAE